MNTAALTLALGPDLWPPPGGYGLATILDTLGLDAASARALGASLGAGAGPPLAASLATGIKPGTQLLAASFVASAVITAAAMVYVATRR